MGCVASRRGLTNVSIGFVLPSTTSACHGGVCARASMLDKGSLMVVGGGVGAQNQLSVCG